MEDDNCLIPCEGIYADVTKIEAKKVTGKYYETLLKSYNKYKRFFKDEDSNENYAMFSQIPAKLRYVKIFFDTATFDLVTMDSSAKV